MAFKKYQEKNENDDTKIRYDGGLNTYNDDELFFLNFAYVCLFN